MAFNDSFSFLSGFISDVKDFIFGENNSRIDTALDYFYSLRQEKRAKIILYSVFSVIFLLILIILVYFLGLYGLRKDLDNAVSNTKELNNLKFSYMDMNQSFIQLTNNIRNNNQYSTLVSILDLKSKDLGIETSPLPEKPPLMDLLSTDPLYPQFQKIKINYKLTSISLRKIIDYIYSIEQMPNKFKVSGIEIQQKFGTKLYFDVNFTVEAYVPVQKSL